MTAKEPALLGGLARFHVNPTLIPVLTNFGFLLCSSVIGYLERDMTLLRIWIRV